MRGGHNAKGLDEHVAAGTFRPARHGEPREPVEWPGEPALPPEIESDPVALACWRRVIRALPTDTLVAADSDSLTMLVRTWVEWQRADEALRKTEPGATKYRGIVSASQQLSRTFRQLAEKFGLSPADRGRLKLPPATSNPAGDPLDQMFAARPTCYPAE